MQPTFTWDGCGTKHLNLSPAQPKLWSVFATNDGAQFLRQGSQQTRDTKEAREDDQVKEHALH